MSKTEKVIDVATVVSSTIEVNASWYSSWICDTNNHAYTADDGKIYNFTISYNVNSYTAIEIKKLNETVEELIHSKTVRVCNMSPYAEVTNEYYFSNSNQYDVVVNYFTK